MNAAQGCQGPQAAPREGGLSQPRQEDIGQRRLELVGVGKGLTGQCAGRTCQVAGHKGRLVCVTSGGQGNFADPGDMSGHQSPAGGTGAAPGRTPRLSRIVSAALRPDPARLEGKHRVSQSRRGGTGSSH